MSQQHTGAREAAHYAADKEAIVDESRRLAAEHRDKVHAFGSRRAHDLSVAPEVEREISRRRAREAHDLLLRDILASRTPPLWGEEEGQGEVEDGERDRRTEEKRLKRNEEREQWKVRVNVLFFSFLNSFYAS